ncbi:MAG: bifunctional diaminohydroxyphosphoribosylaminopyrimidine deaminase/5-amino-6-(5-phosphoribosylamino)uracil reductase RibD [Tannerella sp.]|nr:bifunctional diaminohydroxyphosphoribosylaminopyrimidine deaminase/5-amino-6-(5-phosphoribosylamino)uracil reductase RibD [Tannerella sp.]
MQVEEKFMLRCLELAQSGRPAVAPNPMVGAVIVHKGQIIGEGFHRQYGCAHAEVEAIEAVRDQKRLLDSTLYVNLEPCAHTGKTPPCTQLIIQKRIPRMVTGCQDPNPVVAGKGIRVLRETGIEVVTDVLRQEAMALNRFFITAHTKQRPYVILKWAQSIDGFIDRNRKDASERPVQLSNPAFRRYVHKLRSEVSAIMVGTNTACLDNPSLTVRHWVGKSPVRVVIDRMLRIPPTYHLLDGSVRTLVFFSGARGEVRGAGKIPPLKGTGRRSNAQLSILNSQFSNIEYVPLDFLRPTLPQILYALYERKHHSLLVEGGACLHQCFLDSGLWDEAQIEIAPVELASGVKSAIDHLIKVAEYQNDIYISTALLHQDSRSYISIYTHKKL